VAEYPYGPSDNRYPIKAYIDAMAGGGTSGSGYIEFGTYAGVPVTTATIFHTDTPPENNVTAPPGSLAFVDNGTLFIKLTGAGNTGWQQILVPPPMPEVLATVLSNGTAVSGNYGGSWARIDVGVYQITLTNPQTFGEYVANITPLTAGATIAVVDDAAEVSAAVKTIRTFDAAGNPVDAAFMFQLWTFQFSP